VASAKQARTLAVRLEDDCAAAWRFLYAVVVNPEVAADLTNAALRSSAQRNLTASAVRAAQWSGSTGAFPGL